MIKTVNFAPFKIKGFTVIELMYGIIFIAFIFLIIVKNNSNTFTDNQANQLAVQTQNFAKIAINYVEDNYISLQSQAATSPIYINVAQLTSAGYFPNGLASSNYLGQTPCIYVTLQNSQLIPLLFFVNNNNSKLLSLSAVNNVISKIGGEAGYIDANGNAVSMGNTWQINNARILLSPAQCQGSSMASNSLVMYLALDSSYNTLTQPDQSVKRDPDNLNPVGTANNFNSLQTDISLNASNTPHSIIMNNNQISLSQTDNNGINIQGGLTANSLIPSAGNPVLNNNQTNLATGAACSSSQLGVMASQTTRDFAGQFIANQLQCTFDALLCQGADPNGQPRNGYCFLPVASTQLTFYPNTPTASCPSGFFISGGAQVSPTCICPGGGYPTGASYAKYQTLVIQNIGVNISATGTCNCSDGSNGTANISQLTCTNSNPTVNVYN